MNFKTELQSNNIDIRALIAMANNLPDQSSGVELPELTNEAEETEVFVGCEYIDESGNKKTGTFTIDNELSTQDDLITQMQTALAGKAVAGSGVNLDSEITTQDSLIAELSSILDSKAAGSGGSGSGGASVETCTVEITSEAGVLSPVPPTFNQVYAICLDNNSVTTTPDSTDSVTYLKIENVISNTFLLFRSGLAASVKISGGQVNNSFYSGGGFYMVYITANNGETATITIN